jgi:hypothetical protein
MVQKPMAFHSLASMGRLIGLPMSLYRSVVPEEEGRPVSKAKKTKTKETERHSLQHHQPFFFQNGVKRMTILLTFICEKSIRE